MPVDSLSPSAYKALELFNACAAEKGEAARPDWAHVFLSVLPTLPLSTVADEGRVAAALRSAGATVMARYGASLRRAAVAEWEVRLRVPDGSGAWRLVVSSPTGEGFFLVRTHLILTAEKLRMSIWVGREFFLLKILFPAESACQGRSDEVR